jgi:hypothetical protein
MLLLNSFITVATALLPYIHIPYHHNLWKADLLVSYMQKESADFSCMHSVNPSNVTIFSTIPACAPEDTDTIMKSWIEDLWTDPWTPASCYTSPISRLSYIPSSCLAALFT